MAKLKTNQNSSLFHRLSKLKFQDLKSECIQRGMPFEDIVNSDWHGLKSFIVDNLDGTKDPSKLEEFENWVEAKLLEKGYDKDDALVTFKEFTSNSNKDEREESKSTAAKDSKVSKKPKGEKKAKTKKRQRDDSGLFKGTKKHYVYEGVQKGASIEKVIKKTLAKFPDAKEKSIRIWYRKAKKELENA